MSPNSRISDSYANYSQLKLNIQKLFNHVTIRFRNKFSYIYFWMLVENMPIFSQNLGLEDFESK